MIFGYWLRTLILFFMALLLGVFCCELSNTVMLGDERFSVNALTDERRFFAQTAHSVIVDNQPFCYY